MWITCPLFVCESPAMWLVLVEEDYFLTTSQVQTAFGIVEQTTHNSNTEKLSVEKITSQKIDVIKNETGYNFVNI
jgi:hypothetical protein